MKFSFNIKRIFFSLIVILCVSNTYGQFDRFNEFSSRFQSSGNSSDSLQRRDYSEDSIIIRYRYFDSTNFHTMDSSVNDFNKYILRPYTYSDLGNIGTPAQALLFKPLSMQPGWSQGFHAQDMYAFRLEDTRYFNTTNPYTQLGYMMGSNAEQYINVLHTQNRSRLANFTFEYRLLAAPGAFANQKGFNSNIRANISSQSRDKRYSLNFIVINNVLRGEVNGGIVNLNDLYREDVIGPYGAQTRVGSISPPSGNLFNANLVAGNEIKDLQLYWRNSYDFGQKDSLKVNDTTTVQLFYPRLRLEHAVKYARYSYAYLDATPNPDNYLRYYQLIVPNDTLLFNDKWKELTNQLSVYTFPDKKNSAQYLKIFGDFQLLGGQFGDNSKNFFNIILGGEYRNKTRNKKWDLIASGKFYVLGNYIGDYAISGNIKRELGHRIGSLSLGASNITRTPSFIFNTAAKGFMSMDSSLYYTYTKEAIGAHSTFPIITGESAFAKENITHLYGIATIPALKMTLTGNYYALFNYTYFSDYFRAAQNSSLFNLLQISAEKETDISKYFKWYITAHIQQKAGNVPINVPFLLLRNRIAFEGHFYKNLHIATGFDVVYNTPYKPDLYSPFTGNFFYNNTTTISNRPEIAYYLNFRIRNFRLFSEASNLNTFNIQNNKVLFNQFNFSRPYYPKHAVWIRVGIFWNFVN